MIIPGHSHDKTLLEGEAANTSTWLLIFMPRPRRTRRSLLVKKGPTSICTMFGVSVFVLLRQTH